MKRENLILKEKSTIIFIENLKKERGNIMNFSEVIKENASHTYTENGARAFNTTNSRLLDLFSTIGALRTRTNDEIIRKFIAAFAEDRLLATKMLFYAGNIRGGLGERRTFRVCLKWLANKHPEIVKKNIKLIPQFNRWDSMFELVDTGAEGAMWAYIAEVFAKDIDALTNKKKGVTPQLSLLAKWLPSENASSFRTKALARKTIKKLNLTPKTYRKILSALRAELKIVEGLMSSNNWDQITYSAVPSYAMKNYRNAFSSHDEKRFSEYIESLKRGETKINAATLFPYDIIHAYTDCSRGWSFTPKEYDEILEQQWKSLPNYVDEGSNVLVMADTSGSMYGRPMETSVGLAIYFAQRNKGYYHNVFMSFSGQPSYFYLNDGDTLRQSIDKVSKTPWGFNTNLSKAMETILEDAKFHKLSNEDLPKALVVISDMEIDYCAGRSWDFVENMSNVFESSGYKMPKLIFWNVNSRKDTYLTKGANSILVSGQSASTFKSVLRTIDLNSYEAMLEVLNDPMYDCVQI